MNVGTYESRTCDDLSSTTSAPAIGAEGEARSAPIPATGGEVTAVSACEAPTVPISDTDSNGAAMPESKPKITQAMLKRVVRFNKEKREVQVLIRQMKAAARTGVPVEEGPCTLALRPCKIQRRVPKPIIEALGLSQDEVAQLESVLGAIEGTSATVKEFGEIYPFET